MSKVRVQRYGDMATEHLECRSWQHAWEHEVTFVTTVERRKAYELHLRCMRCPARRRDMIVAGAVVSRVYDYPDGYLLDDAKSWGSRAVVNANVRTELMERLTTVKPKRLRAVK